MRKKFRYLEQVIAGTDTAFDVCDALRRTATTRAPCSRWSVHSQN